MAMVAVTTNGFGKVTKRESASYRAPNMKAEYDLSKLQARKNPYASKLKKPVTMRAITLPITARCKSTGR